MGGLETTISGTFSAYFGYFITHTIIRIQLQIQHTLWLAGGQKSTDGVKQGHSFYFRQIHAYPISFSNKFMYYVCILLDLITQRSRIRKFIGKFEKGFASNFFGFLGFDYTGTL